MTLEPTRTDEMVGKLLAIEMWAYHLRHALTADRGRAPKEKVALACTEIQYGFDQLKELTTQKEGTP
jgi:hypothetical protein